MCDERDVVNDHDDRARRAERRGVTHSKEHVDSPRRDGAWQSRLFPDSTCMLRPIDMPFHAGQRRQTRRRIAMEKHRDAVRPVRCPRPLHQHALQIAADTSRFADQVPAVYADVKRAVTHDVVPVLQERGATPRVNPSPFSSR